MIPKGISQELWAKVDEVCRTMGGMAAISGRCCICLNEEWCISKNRMDEIRERFAPLGFGVEYAGFDDVHAIYDLTLPTDDKCSHVLAYSNEADAVPCPVCERNQLKADLAAAQLREKGLREALKSIPCACTGMMTASGNTTNVCKRCAALAAKESMRITCAKEAERIIGEKEDK